MRDDVPFDVWNGEDLVTEEILDDGAPEEMAMHLDPEEVAADGWSDLVEPHADATPPAGPVSYFADEQPDEPNEPVVPHPLREDPEPDLEQLLERQHYAFRS